MAFSSRGFGRFAFVAAAAGFALSACVVQSSYEQLDAVTPTGSAFSQDLFKDYAYISRSFGTRTATAGTTFDADSSIPLTPFTSDDTDLANAFADKAIVAGRGEEVVVEPAPEGDLAAQQVRLRVLKDIDGGRDKVPEDTARLQTDYDCWIMNQRLDTQKASAARCRDAMNNMLVVVEREMPPPPVPTPDGSTPDASGAPAPADNSAPPPAPASTPAPTAPAASAPVASAPLAATQGGYTILFDAGSANITVNDMAAVQQAIDDARAGKQGHITVVGYTAKGEPRKLGEKRASAVRDLLVKLGARKEAVQISGAASDTGAPDSRRAIIMLTP
jgi:outer membrane protein OmpA-like peptidoglycan-associated protein